MNINDLLLRPSRLPRKQFSEMGKICEPQLPRPEKHRLSEPRGKFNLVKINKNKLPLDFFPKKETFSRRDSSNRLNFPDYSQQLRSEKKMDSERKHYSPEKTSFFGSQEDLESETILKVSGGNRFLNRKFQTREEHKRDMFALEPTRKLNTAAKSYKNQMLQLYPPTYDPQILELLAASSKTQNMRSPIVKGISSRFGQNGFLQDPESMPQGQQSTILKHGISQPVSKLANNANNLSMEQNGGQPMNITFYNAKSTCFPPITRGLAKQL